MTHCTEKRARRQPQTQPARSTFCPNRRIFQGEDLPGVRPEGHAIPALSGMGKARTTGPAFPAVSGTTGARGLRRRPGSLRSCPKKATPRTTDSLPGMTRSGRARGTARRMRRATVRRRFLKRFDDKVRRRATRKKAATCAVPAARRGTSCLGCRQYERRPSFRCARIRTARIRRIPRPCRVSARV